MTIKFKVLREKITLQARRKRALTMRKLAKSPKMKMARKRAARKIASSDKLKKRSMKQARSKMFNKFSGGKVKNDMSLSQRDQIERRLDKIKPKINKIAKKIFPKIKKAEMIKKMKAKLHAKEERK